MSDVHRPIRIDEPIVVLTYANSGAWRLASILAERPDTAWPQANLVLLCQQMAVSWHQIEGTNGRNLSRLAEASIRSVITSMITASCVGTGMTRWSTLAVGAPGAAVTFAKLYPRAKFISFHRSCLDSIGAGLAACPWGLTGFGYDPFAASHPGNSVAALADYWNTYADLNMAFEQRHQDRCLRLRFEDFSEDPVAMVGKISEYAGLDPIDETSLPSSANLPEPRPSLADATRRTVDIPIARIPEHLLDKINKLLAKLGYPEIESTASGTSSRTPEAVLGKGQQA